jgi:hypothetical protein
MVAAEMKDVAGVIINTMIKAREEDPEMKKRLRVLVTSAQIPCPGLTSSKRPWSPGVLSVRPAG